MLNLTLIQKLEFVNDWFCEIVQVCTKCLVKFKFDVKTTGLVRIKTSRFATEPSTNQPAMICFRNIAKTLRSDTAAAPLRRLTAEM